MAYNPTYLTDSAILKQLALGGNYDASALIAMISTTQGFLPPSMSTAQINAINTPTEGLQAYNNETHLPNYYNGTAWQAIGTAAVLPSTVGSIAIFENTSGLLESSGIGISANGDLYWLADGSGIIGKTGFLPFTPDAPVVSIVQDGNNIYLGGSFTTEGYLPTNAGSVVAMDQSGDLLTVAGVPWIMGAVATGNLFVDTARQRLYVLAADLGSEFAYSAANGGNNQIFGLVVFDIASQSFLGTWSTFGLGGGSFPDLAATAQYVDSTNDLWYIANPSGGWNNNPTPNLIRVNSSTGVLDTSYNVAGSNFDGPINALFQDPNTGFLVVAGGFTHFGATAVGGICRLDTTGVIDPTFNVSGAGFAGGAVNTILISPAASLEYYIGGAFTTYNGTTVNGFVRLNTDGSIDGTFPNGVTLTGGAPGTVNIITQDPHGNPNTGAIAIWVGGNFNIYNSNPNYGNLLFLDPNNAHNLFSDLGGGPMLVDGPVSSIAIINNFSGNTYISGAFSTFTDISGNPTTVPGFVATNEFDGSFHPFGQAPVLSRPSDIFATHSIRIGSNLGSTPFGGPAFVMQSSANNQSGYYNLVDAPGNANAPSWTSLKSWSTPPALITSDIQRDGEQLAFFDAYGFETSAIIPPTSGSQTFLASMRMYSDQGRGGRIEWSTHNNNSTRVMWLDSDANLNLTGNALWSGDGQASIGAIIPQATASLNGLQFLAISTAAAAPTNVTVVFANDGTAGGETVSITGTFPPVQAPVTVTVHMQSGVSTILQIYTALQNSFTVTTTLFNTYILGRLSDTVASGTVTFGAPSLARPSGVHAKNETSIGAESYHTRQFVATTSNNTQTRELDVDLNNPDKMVFIEARVVARRTGGSSGTAGDSAYFVIRALCKNIGGTATVIQQSNDSYADNANLSVDIITAGATSYTNGQRFSVAITGDTNNNYSWSGTVITQQV